MKIRKLPPLKYLRECFLYERATGRLFWRNRPAAHFKHAKAAKGWNKKFAGQEALGCVGSRGYRYGNLDGKYCASHRVVWKLVSGKEPPPIVDHRDQNKGNNRWGNLRAATKPQNCINRKLSPRNRTGYGGVHKHRNRNRWVAQLGARDQKRYLGIFDSPAKARRVWLAAAKVTYGEFLPWRR